MARLERSLLLPLAAILAAPWWYGGARNPARYGLAAVLLLAAAVWLWRRVEPLASHVALPAAALLAWSLLQAVLVSPSPVRTLESAVVLAANLGVLVLWAHEGREERAARWLVATVLAVCAAQAAFGVVQASISPTLLYGRDVETIRSPYGSFENHSHFAGLIEMGAVLALGLAFARGRREGLQPATVALAGLGLALAAAHLASRSRGGLLSLMAGAAALLVLWLLASSKRAPSWKEGMTACVVVAALFAFGWLAVPAATRAHLTTLFHGPKDGSGVQRLNVYAATLALWRAHPVAGAGLGMFEDAMTRHKRSDGQVRSVHADSDALELGAEGGLIGVGLVAWLAWSGLRGFNDRLRHGHDPWRKGLAIAAMAAVAALLVHSLVDGNLRVPSNALVFCALAGLAAAPRAEPTAIVAPRAARTAAAVLIVLAAASLWRAAGAWEYDRARSAEDADRRLGGVSAVLARHAYMAEAHFERGQLLWWLARPGTDVERFRLEAARDALAAAVRLRPMWADAWADLAWVEYRLGNVNASDTAFARAADLDPASLRVGRARAEFFLREKRVDEGRQELQRLRRYNPDWPQSAADMLERRWIGGN